MGANSYVCRSYSGKTGMGEPLCPHAPPPILNRVKKHFTALYEDENKLYFNEDSDDAVFNHIEIGIANIDINDVNLDDNFD